MCSKGYTQITKDCFSSSKLGENKNGLSTNGFNASKEAFIDHSKNASSSKYGKSMIQKAHPAWKGDDWKSTTHDTFKDPKKVADPLYR